MPARAPARSGKKKTSSRFTGVNWNKSRSKWLAQIWHAGKQQYIGNFEDEVEAAKAWDVKARSLRGAATPTNFPVQESEAGDELKTVQVSSRGVKLAAKSGRCRFIASKWVC